MNKIKYMLTVLVVVIAAGVIYAAEDIANGIKVGIELCINSVIPSLFLFTIISIFIVNVELFNNNKLIDVLSFLIFGIKGEIGAISLLSTICGYPVGGALINELYLKGKINSTQGRLMLNYCINAGPAFVIGVIGNNLYNNPKIGVIILVASLISTMFTGRTILKKFPMKHQQLTATEDFDYIGAFIHSVNSGVRNIGIVCGWVLISSAFTCVMTNIKWLKFASCLFEVTAGVTIAARDYSVYLVAFLVGFGGISVHLQAMSSSHYIKPSYPNILLWKLIQGVMTCMFTFILLKIFPQSIEVATDSADLVANSKDGNIFTSTVTVLFIISTIIFSNQRINKGRKM